MDFDKVFTAFRNCISEPKCKDCSWEQCEQFNQKKVTIPVTLALDVLNMMKEQKDTINELQNAYGYLQKQFFEAQDKLLKEQEKAKVVFGRCKDGSFATECGHCGMYLDKAYSICPKCNKELDWNSNQD